HAHRWCAALGDGEAMHQFRAIDVEQRVFEFAPRDHRGHTVGADVTHRRIIVVLAGIVAVIGFNSPRVGIFGEVVDAHATADDDETGYARAAWRLETPIISITRGMRGTGRVAHEKETRGIYVQLGRMCPHPIEAGAHIHAALGIARLG